MRRQLHTISGFRNGENPSCYSARASFHYPEFSSGEVLNINTDHTFLFANGNVKCFCAVLSFYFNIISSFGLLFQPATTFLHQFFCVATGIGAIGNILTLLSIANRKLIKRILVRSLTPYVKLYLAIVESYSLCSLLGWRWRCCIVVPILISTQISVFVSDAVFYRDRRYSLCMIVLFILYRIALIVSVRFALFGSLYYRVFRFSGFDFYNSGNFVSKSLSLVLFQVGQLFFYMRYKHRLFSIRTSYTILSNKKWSDLDRRKRLSLQEEKENEVMMTIERLQRDNEEKEMDDEYDLYRV